MGNDFLNKEEKPEIFGIIVLLMAILAFVTAFFAAVNVVSFVISIVSVIGASISILVSKRKDLSIIALLTAVFALTFVVILNTFVYNSSDVVENIPNVNQQEQVDTDTSILENETTENQEPTIDDIIN